jgi:hypothetical protein
MTPRNIVQIVDDVSQKTLQIVHQEMRKSVVLRSAGISPGPEGPIGPTGGVSSTKTTKLSITGSKPVSSVYSVTSGGPGYEKTGDDGDLGTTEVAFNASCSLFVFLNGLNLSKGVQVIRLSPTTFQLEAIVDNGDELLILS